MSKEEILKRDSYLVDCVIIPREKDNGLFNQRENGDVVCKLNKYAVIPKEYLRTISDALDKLEVWKNNLSDEEYTLRAIIENTFFNQEQSN